MIKCQICLRRHRDTVKCEQKFTTGTHDLATEGEKTLLVAAQTRKGILGAAMFAKKRIKPHHSHRLLRIVQLTQQLFPKYFAQIEVPDNAMIAARGEAKKILAREHRLLNKKLRQCQDESRRINRGLNG